MRGRVERSAAGQSGSGVGERIVILIGGADIEDDRLVLAHLFVADEFQDRRMVLGACHGKGTVGDRAGCRFVEIGAGKIQGALGPGCGIRANPENRAHQRPRGTRQGSRVVQPDTDFTGRSQVKGILPAVRQRRGLHSQRFQQERVIAQRQIDTEDVGGRIIDRDIDRDLLARTGLDCRDRHADARGVKRRAAYLRRDHERQGKKKCAYPTE